VSYALIAVTVAVFFIERSAAPSWREVGLLRPQDPAWYQFLSYVFLHDGLMHLLGNMVFLHAFGPAVEDRLGRVGYLAFYLAGGAVAGLGHCLTASAPVLGASGAVAAVTGTFLVWFPNTRITVIYFFILIGAIEITGLYLILLQVALNLFGLLGGKADVAYTAHLAGYGYGFAVGWLLIVTRLLPREPWDLAAMIAHRYRRERFAGIARGGRSPWLADQGRAGPAAGAGAKREPEPESGPGAALRRELLDHLARGEEEAAVEAYARWQAEEPEGFLGRKRQFELANLLTSKGRYGEAAGAYRVLLERAALPPVEAGRIHLLLGALLARHLEDPEAARPHLGQALEVLPEGPEREQARRWEAILGGEGDKGAGES